MTENVADRLAVLVRDRSQGRLSVADYRRLRAPLLDRLVSQRLDEASLITRPRAFARAREGGHARATDDLRTVFAPRSRLGLWMVCALAGVSVVTVAAKMGLQPHAADIVEAIEPVQVKSLRVVERKSPEVVRKETSPSKRPLVTGVRACDTLHAGATPIPCEDKLSAEGVGPRLLVVPAEGSAAFAVAARAISQSQFRMFCEKTARPYPRQPWEDGDPAVANVTWTEASDYAHWLSRETGQRYRLPTEGEWLHAVRVLGNRNGFSAGKVREWVEDPASAEAPEERVVKGTSYADDSTTLLSARRNRQAATRDALTGFRVIREIR